MIAEQMRHRLRLLLDEPPITVARLVRRKLLGTHGDRFTVEDVVGRCAKKHLQPQRMANFLMRAEKIVQKYDPSWVLSFEGKRVLEIGGGPVLGFAPIAVFHGCREAVVIEPSFEPDVLSHPRVEEYFRAVYTDLSAMYEAKMSREAFLEALRSRVRVVPHTLELFEDAGVFDVSLSQSVLEHVRDLDAAIERLAQHMAPRAMYMHLVNFGNHRGTPDPFQDMYTHTREAYWERFGHEVNLLRANDVKTAFAGHGLAPRRADYIVRDALATPPMAWWAERYVENDLRTRVAIFSHRSSV